MEMKQLLKNFAFNGKVEWLSYRPGPTSRGTIKIVEAIEVTEQKESGSRGGRSSGGRGRSSGRSSGGGGGRSRSSDQKRNNKWR